jgi:hypothetical protein
MLVTALALVALIDPPARKEPLSKTELAAIGNRGLDLAGCPILVRMQVPPEERGE